MQPVQNYLVKVVTHMYLTHMSNQSHRDGSCLFEPLCRFNHLSTPYCYVSVCVKNPSQASSLSSAPSPPPSSHRQRFKTTPHAALQCSSPLPPAAPPHGQSVNAMPSMSLFMCPRFQDQVGDACVGPKHPRPLFGMLPMCRLSSH
jgi:hypothetical protein